MTDDNAWLRRKLAEQEAENAARLKEAKGEAKGSGKEPFNFDKLCLMYDPRSDMAPADQPITEEMRDRYELKYYVYFADVMTIEEFVARLNAVDELPTR